MNVAPRSLSRWCALFSLCTALSAPGQIPPQSLPSHALLAFTELSDTHLVATLDGVPFGTITQTQPDSWTWDSGIGLSSLSGASIVIESVIWLEPPNETGYNLIGYPTLTQDHTLALPIRSDGGMIVYDYAKPNGAVAHQALNVIIRDNGI